MPRSHLPVPRALLRTPPLPVVVFVLLLLGSACVTADAEDPDVSLDAASDEAAASLPDGGAGLVAVGPTSGPLHEGQRDDASEPEPVKPDETPPGLVVLSVAAESTAADTQLVFKGFSEPGATVSAGAAETVTDDDGRWYLELSLEDGQDTAVVTSTDAAGNEIEKEVTVTFEEPEPVVYVPPKDEVHAPIDEPHKEPIDEPHEPKEEQPPLEKEPVYEFSAWTKFGICTEHPVEKTGGEGSEEAGDVLTKFKGTGIPGTAVIVDSAWGEAITEVNDDGYWWIQIEFANGAAESEFTAVVTNGEHAAWFRCGLI